VKPTASNDKPWALDSWRGLKAEQQPNFEDQKLLAEVVGKIRAFPPLVFSGEVEQLKLQLADAAHGKRFVLQGGDCAERFQDCRPDSITRKLKIILQMSLILTYGTRRPVVRIGRIAGQYGKPRSSEFEEISGIKYPVFRGDNVNAFEADLKARKPDPARLLTGYHNAAITLNFIRALLAGGFADLHSPEHWNLTFFASNKVGERYADVINHIKDAISFVSAIGANIADTLKTVNFYTSHEGLILPYEEALTRRVPIREKYYDLSAHMLWIGDRTRQLDGAHVEFFRGVANPVGIKVGPSADPEEIVALINRLNPTNEQGKIVLISRFGQEKASQLAKFIAAVKKAKQSVLWSVDPMHGNMIKTKDNIKTRDFDAVLSELEQSFRIHRENKSILGGVHFEMTGDDVTECIGGAEELNEEDLTKNYESYCDPRLNYSQSLEMAFLIASMFR
jgi:3-deoxy-7-phosphoheptulonate synthase